MSQNLQSVLEAARQLLPEQRRRLAAQLLEEVDGIAKRFKNTDQELQIVGERASRMEDWIKRAANKIGVEYKP